MLIGVVLSADGLAWPAVPCRASVNVWYVGVLGLILVRVSDERRGLYLVFIRVPSTLPDTNDQVRKMYSYV